MEDASRGGGGGDWRHTKRKKPDEGSADIGRGGGSRREEAKALPVRSGSGTGFDTFIGFSKSKN